jgi:phosphoglycolate phosphatase
MPSRFFVIFDLDGTLFDTRADIAAAINAGLHAVGLPEAEVDTVTGFVGNGVGRLVDRTVQTMGGDLMLAPPVAQALMAHYRAHPVVHTQPYAGVDELLAGWADVPLAIASNKPTDLCRAIVGHFGWTHRFRAILGADWGGPKKPDPAVLVHLAAEIGQPPERGVMVGDSVADLEAGRAAGMLTVAALYGFRPAQELLAAEPDHVIHRVADLPAVVETHFEGH